MTQVVQPIITTAVDHLEDAETSALRLAHLEVLINAILYNPAAALHIMEQHKPGTAGAFLEKWFATINSEKDKLPRVHDKKLTLEALCALMTMDPAAIPTSVQKGWQGLITAALKVFESLPKAVESKNLSLVPRLYPHVQT